MQPKPFMNVREQWLLYDSVGVFNSTGYQLPRIPGWFLTFAAMGAANEIDFFNVRNRNVGLMYTNQDSRDNMPYGFRCTSIGISMWAMCFTQAPTWATDTAFSPDDNVAHIWQNDLPRHASITFRVQQDDILKCTALMAPPGYGPVGSGYSRGSPTLLPTDQSNGFDMSANVITQGNPFVTCRWTFPLSIDIPRRATLNVKLKWSEWARQLLAVLPQGLEFFGIQDGDDIMGMPSFAGIQCSLAGERLVQQRGQHHV
jgi:hypothetical protein